MIKDNWESEKKSATEEELSRESLFKDEIEGQTVEVEEFKKHVDSLKEEMVRYLAWKMMADDGFVATRSLPVDDTKTSELVSSAQAASGVASAGGAPLCPNGRALLTEMRISEGLGGTSKLKIATRHENSQPPTKEPSSPSSSQPLHPSTSPTPPTTTTSSSTLPGPTSTPSPPTSRPSSAAEHLAVPSAIAISKGLGSNLVMSTTARRLPSTNLRRDHSPIPDGGPDVTTVTLLPGGLSPPPERTRSAPEPPQQTTTSTVAPRTTDIYSAILQGDVTFPSGGKEGVGEAGESGDAQGDAQGGAQGDAQGGAQGDAQGGGEDGAESDRAVSEIDGIIAEAGGLEEEADNQGRSQSAPSSNGEWRSASQVEGVMPPSNYFGGDHPKTNYDWSSFLSVKSHLRVSQISRSSTRPVANFLAYMAGHLKSESMKRLADYVKTAQPDAALKVLTDISASLQNLSTSSDSPPLTNPISMRPPITAFPAIAQPATSGTGCEEDVRKAQEAVEKAESELMNAETTVAAAKERVLSLSFIRANLTIATTSSSTLKEAVLHHFEEVRVVLQETAADLHAAQGTLDSYASQLATDSSQSQSEQRIQHLRQAAARLHECHGETIDRFETVKQPWQRLLTHLAEVEASRTKILEAVNQRHADAEAKFNAALADRKNAEVKRESEIRAAAAAKTSCGQLNGVDSSKALESSTLSAAISMLE